MLLSAGMMLDWLGERHGVAACSTAAEALQQALERGFRSRAIHPIEQGGTQTTTAVAKAVIGLL
jgi:3-isopropylmalate dehydrogenase